MPAASRTSASRTKNGAAWLSFVALIVAICIQNFVYNGVLVTWPRWILWVLNAAANLLIPVMLVALAGRVAVHLADTRPSINWRIGMAGALVIILMLLLLMVHIVELTLVDGTGDDGTLFPPMIFGLSAVAVALMLVWTLERRRIPVVPGYLVVMLAAICGFLAVTYRLAKALKRPPPPVRNKLIGQFTAILRTTASIQRTCTALYRAIY